MRVISLLGAAIILLIGGGLWVRPAPAATSERPSFLIAGETFCLDEVEFDRFAQTGQLPMHAQDSCTVMRNVTRVVVMSGSSGHALVWIASGPMEGDVGWTNGRLPQ